MNNASGVLVQIIKKIVLLLLCISAFISTSVSATIATENKNDRNLPTREIVLENDKVQVVRLTYPAGTESGMHTHDYAHRVVYFVKGGTLMLVPKNKNKPSKKLHVTNGQTLFLPASSHNVKNIGTTEVVIVETELK